MRTKRRRIAKSFSTWERLKIEGTFCSRKLKSSGSKGKSLSKLVKITRIQQKACEINHQRILQMTNQQAQKRIWVNWVQKRKTILINKKMNSKNKEFLHLLQLDKKRWRKNKKWLKQFLNKADRIARQAKKDLDHFSYWSLFSTFCVKSDLISWMLNYLFVKIGY